MISGKSARVENPQNSEALQTEIAKLRKDFNYLRKPSIVPRAYEASLSEMKRRLMFRMGLDEQVAKLKKAIEVEKDLRTSFINTHQQYLPSHFHPKLKELTPILSLDGEAFELKFPDFRRCADIKCPTPDLAKSSGSIELKEGANSEQL